jgi:hypothetical protein
MLTASQIKCFYKICICCFSAKHGTLSSKNKHWLARNRNDVSEWSAMSTLGVLFQCVSTIQIQLGAFVLYKADIITNSSKWNVFSPWYSWENQLALNNNHKLTPD